MKENCKKPTKEKQTKAKRSNGNSRYSKRVRAKLFCCAFKLGVLQLICQASLNFKSNLELALLIILKQWKLYESKYAAVECRCLKIWDLLSLFICSSILVLKWRQVSRIWPELQFLYKTLCEGSKDCFWYGVII